MQEKITKNYKNKNAMIGSRKANPFITETIKNKTFSVQDKRVFINGAFVVGGAKKTKRVKSNCTGCSRRRKK